MLWALAQPAACAGLISAFLSAVLLRGCVQRAVGSMLGVRATPPTLALQHTTEVFGTLAAVVSGVGWGARTEARRHTLLLLSGPIALIALSQLLFAVDAALHTSPHRELAFFHSIDALRGVPDVSAWDQFLLAWSVGVLAWGVLAFTPLPPLDGWGVLRNTLRTPRWESSRVVYWLEYQNVGVAILLAGLLLPTIDTTPLLLHVLDIFLTPVFQFWMG